MSKNDNKKLQTNEDQAAEVKNVENSKKDKPGFSFATKFRGSKKVKYGTYSTVLIIIVIIAVVLVNVGTTILTNNFDLALDLTRNRKYTLSATSKNVINRLDKDIYIYALYSETVKDNYPDYTKLFENFAKESDFIHIEYVDPTANPAFTNQFLGGSITAVSAGSIIVSRGDASKFRILTSYDFYDYQYNSDYTSVTATAFKGEDAVSNALLYVNSDSSPKLYWLTGHGETAITSFSEMRTYLERESFECLTMESTGLAALTTGDTLIVVAPQRDLSEVELEQLKVFVNDGGRLVYLSTPGIALPNFEELLGVFGIGLNQDVVVEGSASYYYYSPVIIVPQLGSHNITLALRSNNLSALMQGTHSLSALDVRNSALTVENVLTTSSSSYAKMNLESTTIEKEEGDKTGPFTIAMSAEIVNDYYDAEKSAKAVVFGSSAFLTTNYALAGNADLFLQTVKYLQNGETDTVSIIGKSMLEDSLSFTSYAQLYGAAGVAAIAIPVVILAWGVVVWIRRRHL